MMRPPPWQLSVVVVVVAFAACTPTPPAVPLRCTADHDCAEGYRCGSDGRCRASADAGPAVLDDGGGGQRDSGAPVDAGTDLDGGTNVDGGTDLDGGTNLDGGVIDGVRLFAVHPELARAGDEVVLEGRFPAGTCTASFGGATVSRTLTLPATRVSLPVPATARSGALTVTCSVDGVDEASEPLPFRVVTFTPALGAFSPHLEQTVSARVLPTTTEPLDETFALSTGRWLHVVDSGTSPAGIIERARVYADGTLGPFTATPGFSLPKASGRAYVRAGAWLYAIGGDLSNNDASSALVERAHIAADGTIGVFSAAGLPQLGTERAYAAAVVVGDWLYVLGGRGGEAPETALTSSERARVLADGTLGPFTPVPSTLAFPRDMATAHVTADALYVVGGTGANTTIERAPILADGAPGSFALVTTSNFIGRRLHAGVVLGTELCVLGGQTGSTRIASVQCAVLDDSASLVFSNRPPLRSPRSSHGAVVLGNRVLVLGGDDGSEQPPPEWAPIDVGALPDTLASDATAALPTLGDVACAVVEDRVLVTGGFSGGLASSLSDKVYAAEVDADGRLGPFLEVATLATARRGHRVAIVDDELWVMGGVASGGLVASIERAPLGETLSFTAAPVTLAAPLSHFYAYQAGDALLVAGGEDDSGASNAVSCLDLAAAEEGDVPFASCGVLSEARGGPVGATLGDTAYVIGGAKDGAWFTSLDEAALSPPGGFAASSLSLGTGRRDALALFVGGGLHVIGGTVDGTAVLNRESAAVGPDGTLTTGFTSTSLPLSLGGGCALALGNYVHVLAAGDLGVGQSHYAGVLVTPPSP